MKTIKPKKMPKRLEASLRMVSISAPNSSYYALSPRECRAILAALAYERQRADAAGVRAHLAEHHSRLRPSEDDAHAKHVAEHALRQQMAANAIPPLINPLIAPIHYVDRHADGGATVHVVTPDYQRTQTAAVVPKPRKKA